MVAGTTMDDVVSYLGTDGSQVVHAGVMTPYNRRSFGANELLQYMVFKGYSVTPLIPKLRQGPENVPGKYYEYSVPMSFIAELMLSYDGVITGDLPTGTGHAVAWSHVDSLIYDPKGLTYPLSDSKLEMETFWLCTPLTRLPNYLKPCELPIATRDAVS